MIKMFNRYFSFQSFMHKQNSGLKEMLHDYRTLLSISYTPASPLPIPLEKQKKQKNPANKTYITSRISSSTNKTYLRLLLCSSIP
jgi:hypothetical protein